MSSSSASKRTLGLIQSAVSSSKPLRESLLNIFPVKGSSSVVSASELGQKKADTIQVKFENLNTVLMWLEEWIKESIVDSFGKNSGVTKDSIIRTALWGHKTNTGMQNVGTVIGREFVMSEDMLKNTVRPELLGILGKTKASYRLDWDPKDTQKGIHINAVLTLKDGQHFYYLPFLNENHHTPAKTNDITYPREILHGEKLVRDQIFMWTELELKKIGKKIPKGVANSIKENILSIKERSSPELLDLYNTIYLNNDSSPRFFAPNDNSASSRTSATPSTESGTADTVISSTTPTSTCSP